MGSLDTNLLLRLFLGDVPDQAEKIGNMLAAAKPNSFEVADAVLFECVWVMSGPMYGLDRRIIADIMMQLTRIPQIKCNRALIERVVPLYVRHPRLSFIDVCLVTCAEFSDALPLLTYDKKLAKALPKLTKLVA